MVDIRTALLKADTGDLDDAIAIARATVNELTNSGEMLLRAAASAALVAPLLMRGNDTDVHEARSGGRPLAAVPTEPGFVLHDIWLLRLRALLARAQVTNRLSRLSGSLPRDGDIAWLRGAYEVGRGDAMTAAAPSGVVTFLFTDVEGSTRRWEADADGMRAALAAHDEVLRRRLRRTAASCSSTPVTACARRSPRRGPPSMLLWLRSGRWSCRCGWGWRPAKPNCARGTTSVRCSTVRRG